MCSTLLPDIASQLAMETTGLGEMEILQFYYSFVYLYVSIDFICPYFVVLVRLYIMVLNLVSIRVLCKI